MVSAVVARARNAHVSMGAKVGKLTVLNKNVDYDSYDCVDCMDTGHVWDEEAGRNRPCPCRRAT